MLGYSGLVTNIVNPLYRREFVDEKIAENQNNFARSPLVLNATEWLNDMLMFVDPLNLTCEDEEIRLNNRMQLKQELKFAFHVNYQGTIVINLDNNDPKALGECVLEVLNSFTRQIEANVVVQLTMKDKRSFQSAYTRSEEDDDEAEPSSDPWIKYRDFIEATNHHPRIEVALVMTQDLPPTEEINRWFGECISMIIVPNHCFVSNAKNYPVLPVAHKKMLSQFIQVTKSNVCVDTSSTNDHLLKSYAEFVRFLANNSIEKNEQSGFEDQLRIPLQPMYDDLDMSTYEIFERDPAKYSLYQQAIEQAVIDKVPEDEIESKTLIVMILGAGRGPLIRAALNAADNTGRKLQIIVVEKNQNAIVTLSAMIELLWRDKNIQLFSRDMRTMELREKADIIVSELLGSFGDNELSPECLDGAQKHLKPDGISIPCDSRTFLRPVMTRHNLNQISMKLDKRKSERSLYSHNEEINWLIYLSSAYYIDQPQELWQFVHPNLDSIIDNQRISTVKFKSSVDCTLHGFAGYFTSKLYKDIELSILPRTHTEGMGSWYPMLFFCESRNLAAGEEFTVEFKRRVEQPVKVWYEWRVNDGKVYNENGAVHPLLL